MASSENPGSGSDDVDAKAFNKIKDFFTGSSGNCVESPTSQDDPKYDMSHTRRRLALIFNNKNFRGNADLTRHGSDVDVNSLQKTLADLKFEVFTKNDVTLQDMRDALRKLASEDHSSVSCVLVAILSHGEQDGVMSSDNLTFKLNEFYDQFSADQCSSLAGKPKILIVQACQGRETDPGLAVRLNARTASDSSSTKTFRIPNRADFITVLSSVPGYVAFRKDDEGSWFIQSFTKIMQNFANKLDFLSMMTYVAREVAMNFESVNLKNPEYHSKKQVPYVTSTLTREIWL